MVRYMLSFALALALTVPALSYGQVVKETKAVRVKGKIVKVQGTDQFVVQTTDNKEVPFYTGTSTRYMINGKAARFADFKNGNEVTIMYVPDGDRYVVQQIYVGDEPKPEETFYEGEIVKVVGQDQVVIRTADKKEVIVYVDPKTTYTIGEKDVRFTDLTPGTNVRVDYDLRERRPYARSFRGTVRPRR